MKPKTTSSILDRLRHRFPPMRLYRPDIEELLRLSDVRGLKAKISDDKFEFDGLDDVKEHRGERVRQMHIEFRADENSFLRSVDVEIDSDGILLRSYKDDKLVPFWHEIKDFFENRTPWYAKLMKPLAWVWAATVVLWLGPNVKEAQTWPKSTLYIWIALVCLTVTLSAASWLYLRQTRGVYLKREHEVQSLWDRYGEKLVPLVIGTVLGVLGKVLADQLTGK